MWLYILHRYTSLYFIPIRILQYTSLQGIGHWNPSLITSAAERRYHLWFGDCNQDAAAILHQCAVSKLDQPTEKTWLVHKRRALRMLQARLYKLSIWIEIRENASHTSLQRSPIASTRMPVSWQTETLQDSVWWPETIYSNLQYTIGAISCIQSPFTAVPFLTASSRLIISPCPYQILSPHDNWSNFEIFEKTPDPGHCFIGWSTYHNHTTTSCISFGPIRSLSCMNSQTWGPCTLGKWPATWVSGHGVGVE